MQNTHTTMSTPPGRAPAPAPNASDAEKGKGKAPSLASNLFSGAGVLQDLTAGLDSTQKAPSVPSASAQAWEGSQVFSGAPGSAGAAAAFASGAGQAFRSNPSSTNAGRGDEAYGAFAAPPSASTGFVPEAPGKHFDSARLPATPAGWDQAWSGSTTPSAAAFAQKEKDADFLALLEAEEQTLGSVPQGQSSFVDAAAPAPGTAAHVPSAFLAHEVGLARQNIAPVGYEPPEPGVDTMSAEQAEMHLALDALQHSDRPDRVAERIVPPDDNQALHQGVYAPTEQEALREIIGGQAQVQHLNSQLESQTRTAATQSHTQGSQWEQLRTYMPRGTYVDVCGPVVRCESQSRILTLRRRSTICLHS